MDIRKKELYEVFADSLEKSRTKEGGLLFDKLFEDMWEHIEPKLGQSLPIDSVSERYILVEWLNEIPLVDGSLYFDSKEELLEHFKSLPKIEGLTHTICRIRNAR